MEAHIFLLQLVIILFSARVMGELASYFKLPSVIGELFAGIIIGPSLLGLISLNIPLELLAEVGIVLLLFEVGTETDLKLLTSSGPKAFLVAIGGLVLPFVSGYLLSYYTFGLSNLISLFIASTLTATSIGITLRVLKDLKRQGTHESHIILGAAVFDDVVGIILLAALYEFAVSGVVNLWGALRVLIWVILFFCCSPAFAKCLAEVIKKWEEKTQIPGLVPTAIVALIFFFGWIAHCLGAPALLGGFAAGLALSKHFKLPFVKKLNKSLKFSEQVENQMKPIIHLFTPIFFVAIGMSLNLKVIEWSSSYIWLLMGSLFAVAVLGKLLAGFCITGEPLSKKLSIGVAMVPRGEVGLIFANIGLTSGVFSRDVYTALVLVITFTTLLAPAFLRLIYSKVDTKRFHLFK